MGKHFLSNLYFQPRFYAAVAAVAVVYVLGYFYPLLSFVGDVGLALLIFLTLIDIFALFRHPKGIMAHRSTPERFSNGDDNPVQITVENRHPIPITARIIDEIPFQFQLRDVQHTIALGAGRRKVVTYYLKPVQRGEYHFGMINVYARSSLGLVARRYRFPEQRMVPVYPSYIQMRQYELLAISNRLTEVGIKRIRRVGHTMEFDQIREYVVGDDYRTINWKATARRHTLMVNQYQDERAQNVYSVIDMGRVMKMPFEGMSLLDYAINASLVISNIAILKHDKAGTITFSHKMGSLLPADRRPTQMAKILELLYNQETDFLESNYELLFATLMSRVTHRSLILLFTNFESLTSLRRQLHYFRRLARRHLLVVIFFENSELRRLTEAPARSTEEIYLKTIAEQFAFEKKQIVKELERYGIHAILTAPRHLTVNTINKYLTLKALGLI
ncbi:MAG: DUF58 domain-containing protein [Calditrichaeota bacterium]|nr:MAG: DUF58 domain-containing protein [Calditrichota bacterium]